MCIARSLMVIALCAGLLGCSGPKRTTLETTFVPSIGAGFDSTCVTFSDAQLVCYGQFVANKGALQSTGNATPAAIGPVKFFALGNVNPFGCAITGVPDPNNASGPVLCWTDDGNPTPVPNITNAISVSVGGPGACAVLVDHSVTCWALTSTNAIGNYTSTFFPTTPGAVTLPTPIAQVSVGAHFACALSVAGPQVYCWGRNDAGQLGRGTVNGSNDPDQPVGLVTNLSAKQIAAGHNHACAIAIDNTVRCWGDSTFGELGNGPNTQTSVSTPQLAVGINNASHITAGPQFTCATLSDQTARCWGDNLHDIPNASTLGVGKFPTSTSGGIPVKPLFENVPIAVRGLTGVIFISAGLGHTCASGKGAAIHCWGTDEYGQLADGCQPTQLNSCKNSLVPVTP